MVNTRENLDLELAVRNEGGLRKQEGLYESNLQRDVHLKIERVNSECYYIVLSGPLLRPEEDWTAKLSASTMSNFALVQSCRTTWMKKVVDMEKVVDTQMGEKRLFPFRDSWDHSDKDAAGLREAFAELALAGDTLFYNLFIADADPRMKRLATKLQELTKSQELNISITSDEFFIPWSLLYTHPQEGETLAVSGENFHWEGFWGYRHIIEHNLEQSGRPKALAPGADGRLVTSFNIDNRIDEQLNVKCIQPQRMFFENLPGLGIIERTKRSEFIEAIVSNEFADQIVYFCCHGKGSNDPTQVSAELAGLTLSDDTPITAADIEYHLQRLQETSLRRLCLFQCSLEL